MNSLITITVATAAAMSVSFGLGLIFAEPAVKDTTHVEVEENVKRRLSSSSTISVDSKYSEIFIEGYNDGRNRSYKPQRSSEYYKGWTLGNCMVLDWVENCATESIKNP